MDMPADEIYEKIMSIGILEQGIEQGMELGVEEASRISGFSLETLESGELKKDNHFYFFAITTII